MYATGSVAIARLAPQDYHRWHVPVGGKLGIRTVIKGGYLPATPSVVQSHVDVYGENVRQVLEMESPDFGHVTIVPVGCSVVGSITITAEENEAVRKGSPHGFFAFGGSTVLVFFEKGRIKFDSDLVSNSKKGIETLVQVNSRLGKASKPANKK